VGYVNPVGLEPAFLEPVFASTPLANEFYLQDIDIDDCIVRFVPGVDDEDVIQSNCDIVRYVGDEALYAFSPGPREEIIVGNVTELTKQLMPMVDRYVNRPALMLNLVEFCNATALLTEARLRVYTTIKNRIHLNAARAWRDNQVLLPLIRDQFRMRALNKGATAKVLEQIGRVDLTVSRRLKLIIGIPNGIYDIVCPPDEGDRPHFDVDAVATFDSFGITSIRAIAMRGDHPSELIDSTSSRRSIRKHRTRGLGPFEQHRSEINSWMRALTADASPDIINSAVTWLSERADLPWLGHIFSKLLLAAGTRKDIVDMAMTWLDHHPGGLGASKVFGELLSMARARAHVVDNIVGWIDENHESINLSARRILIVTEDNFIILSKTMAWFLLNGRPTQVAELLESYIPLAYERGQFAGEITAWLERNLNRPSAGQLLSVVFLAKHSAANLVEIALNWLRQQPDVLEPGHVFYSLHSAVRLRRAVRDQVVAWGDVNKGASGARELVSRLLDYANPR
jgi:hypothetical protein